MKGRQQTSKLAITSLSTEDKGADSITSLIDIFPTEVMVEIFNYLPHQDLHTVKFVNKKWKQLAEKPHYEKVQQEQLDILEVSELWRYLHAMVNNGDILKYYEEHIYFRKLEDYESLTLSQLCSNFHKVFPNCNLYPYGKKISAEYLSERAKFIVDKINAYHPQSELFNSIEKFLKFPLEFEREQREVFLAYLEMESIFSVMRLMIEMRQFINSSPDRSIPTIDIINIISYNSIYNWITGGGLAFVNSCYLQFIPILVEHSIDLKINVSQEQITDQPMNESVFTDAVLNKLTSDDWLAVLRYEHTDYYRARSRIEAFMRAIEFNHSLLAQCNEAVLLEIVSLDGSYGSKKAILKSPLALRHLSDPYLIEFSELMTSDNFEQILNTNPTILNRFSFKVAIELLEKSKYSDYAKLLLLQKDFLNKLKLHEICEIANFLTGDCFSELLTSPAFLALLDITAATKRSHFLVSLAKTQPCLFPFQISQNDSIVDMLEDDDIEKISQLSSRTEYALKERFKLSNKTFSFLMPHNQNYVQIEVEVTSEPACDLEDNENEQIDVNALQDNNNDEDENDSCVSLTLQPPEFDSGVLTASSDGIKTPTLSPMTSAHQRKINADHTKSTVHPWKKALMIAGLLLLGLIGIGLIVTSGIGALIGLPLLIQIVLLAIGIPCMLSSAGISIYNLFFQNSTSTLSGKTSSQFMSTQKNITNTLQHNQTCTPSSIKTVTNIIHIDNSLSPAFDSIVQLSVEQPIESNAIVNDSPRRKRF